MRQHCGSDFSAVLAFYKDTVAAAWADICFLLFSGLAEDQVFSDAAAVPVHEFSRSGSYGEFAYWAEEYLVCLAELFDKGAGFGAAKLLHKVQQELGDNQYHGDSKDIFSVARREVFVHKYGCFGQHGYSHAQENAAILVLPLPNQEIQ